MILGTQRSLASFVVGAAALLLTDFTRADLDATLVQTATNTSALAAARIAAAEALIGGGADARSVCSNLVEVFLHKSETPELRRAMGLALRRVNDAEHNFVPALMVVLKDKK